MLTGFFTSASPRTRVRRAGLIVADRAAQCRLTRALAAADLDVVAMAPQLAELEMRIPFEVLVIDTNGLDGHASRLLAAATAQFPNVSVTLVNSATAVTSSLSKGREELRR